MTPALFLSHGSPLLAVTDGPARRFLQGLGATLGAPRAIVVASAHFVTRGFAVASAPRLQAWHDFGGFPPELYRLRYGPPGDDALAVEAAALLKSRGLQATPIARERIDHGIWVPLSLMYPDAQVPVVSMSLEAGFDPQRHVAAGEALQPLRARGVLVIGSGSITHNLADIDPDAEGAEPLAYASEFADWVTDAIERGDRDALADWHERAPHAARAHPSDEHFAPLLVAAGAASDGHGRLLHQSWQFPALAMHAYAFD